MSTFSLRPIAFGVVLILLCAIAVPAMASCVTTDYNVFVGVPPTANWIGPIWLPPGIPGVTGSCDAAINTNVTTHIVVNSVIPNALGGLDFNCSSCVIDIQPGGQLTIGGTGLVRNGAIVKLNGGTLVVNTPAAEGGVSFQSSSQLHILSGTISGTGLINVDSDSTILYDSASNATISGVTIKTNGTMTLAPSVPTTLTLTNGAIIDNWGIIDINASVDISNGSGVNGILNGGQFYVAFSAESLITAKFDNLGGADGVIITDGILKLGGGGTGNAPFFIGGDSVLEFTNDYTMLPGGTVSGGGLLYVNGGTLTIGGVTEPDRFRISSGTLTGDGFLSTKNFEWTGGTISGNGGTELAGSGTGNFSGSDGNMLLDGRVLNNYGYISYTSGTNTLELSNGAIFGVYGTFDIQTDGSITCDCTIPSLLKIAPNGFFYKGSGSGTFLVDVPSENTASVASYSGTLEFAGDGTHYGSFYVAGGSALSFSAANTTLGVNSNVNGDGTIEFPQGNTQIEGNYEVAGGTTISGANVTVSNASDTGDFNFVTGALTVDADFTMHGTGTWSCGTVAGTGGVFRIANGASMTIDGALSPPTLNGAELVND
ncbi:MAG TPA: hypothetical protein VGQ76_04135, partial [Thermoanaerobaculia bacterium]|nr:hypothetical protein [Thermoanaerobaculia bacterium]